MKRARYPIEVYFLLIPGLIIFSADVIVNSILGFPFDAEIISKIPPVLKTGGKGFGTGSVIILLVLAMYVIFAPNRKGIPDEKREKERGVLYVVRSFFVLAMVVAVALWAMIFATLLLFLNVPASAAIQASHHLINLEFRVFGTLPWLTVQQYFPFFLEPIIIYSYNIIYLVIGATIGLLFVFSKMQLRQLIISFFTVFYAGFILWLTLPALSPGIIYYFFNAYGIHVSDALANIIRNFQPSPFLSKYVSNLSNYWFEPNSLFLNVSNFPSAHAAWGFIAAYFGIKLYRPLAFFYVPWCILNFIATFYLLQHFVLDGVAGLFLAALSIYIGVKLINRDQASKVDDSRLYLGSDVINGSMHNLFGLWKHAHARDKLSSQVRL
jgi:hypothetical protein